MPDDSETVTMRVTTIAGQRYAEDYAVIWRGLSIGRHCTGYGRAARDAAVVVELPPAGPTAGERRTRDRCRSRRRQGTVQGGMSADTRGPDRGRDRPRAPSRRNQIGRAHV